MRLDLTGLSSSCCLYRYGTVPVVAPTVLRSYSVNYNQSLQYTVARRTVTGSEPNPFHHGGGGRIPPAISSRSSSGRRLDADRQGEGEGERANEDEVAKHCLLIEGVRESVPARIGGRELGGQLRACLSRSKFLSGVAGVTIPTAHTACCLVETISCMLFALFMLFMQ